MMNMVIVPYERKYLPGALAVWNEVVRDGVAFPQDEPLDDASGDRFFAAQSFTGLALDHDSDTVAGLYILHPNNVGRCGHIANASYAVGKTLRGSGIGEALVKHSLSKGKELGYRILQFNAVVRSNAGALHLYRKLGFVRLGVIPEGFRLPDGSYEAIIPHYRLL